MVRVRSIGLCSLLGGLIVGNSVNAQSIPFKHVVVDQQGPLNPWGKSVGDLNGDQRPDLIVGGSKSGGLVWYENPTWSKHGIAKDGRWSTDHECVDLDHDGDVDIVALSTSALVWLENPSWSIHVIDRVVLHDVEVADFDGDGDYDLVGRDQGEFGHSGATLHFYCQSSLNDWKPMRVTCPDGEGLATSDMDGDADIDVVINSVWFENKTNDDGFEPSAWREHRYAPKWIHEATFVDVVDLNADGRMDVLLSPSELAGQRYRISWFEAPTEPTTDEWVEHPIALDVEAVHHFAAAADLDLDGDIDVVTAEMQQGVDPDQVTIYRNQGDCDSWNAEVIATTGSHSMRLIDVDADGDLDLFGANHQGRAVDLWVNLTRSPEARTEQSSRAEWTYIQISDSLPSRCFGIAAADVDQDGDHDLAIGETVLLNPGAGMDGRWDEIELGSHVDANVMLDLQQDGKMDILAQRLPEIVWLKGTTTSGDAFKEHVIASGIGSTGHGSSQGFATGDINGDGLEDYVLTTGEGIFVLPLPKNPSQLPWERWKITDNAPEEGVAVGDINGDGWLDVVAWVGSGSGSNQLGWWQNPGPTNLADNSFWQLTLVGEVEGAEGDRVALGDFNEDGRLDIAATGTTNQAQGSGIYWFRNPAGPKDWERHAIAEDLGALNSMSVADISGDHLPDIITGEHRGKKRVQIWTNTDQGARWNGYDVDTGKESHLGTQLVDLDRDGDLDIVSIGWDDFRHVHLWRNDTR